MGTNYYLHRDEDCQCCGRLFTPLHIGKSSGGWCFSLHVMPEHGINTLEDWRKRWAEPGAYIRNEYGERVSIADMELTITKRYNEKNLADVRRWQGFYLSEQDFHQRNYSEPGPFGLLRHCLGDRCVAHGEGTWDYIMGEFS